MNRWIFVFQRSVALALTRIITLSQAEVANWNDTVAYEMARRELPHQPLNSLESTK